MPLIRACIGGNYGEKYLYVTKNLTKCCLETRGDDVVGVLAHDPPRAHAVDLAHRVCEMLDVEKLSFTRLCSLVLDCFGETWCTGVNCGLWITSNSANGGENVRHCRLSTIGVLELFSAAVVG